jgi:hypothetical protein
MIEWGGVKIKRVIRIKEKKEEKGIRNDLYMRKKEGKGKVE